MSNTPLPRTALVSQNLLNTPLFREKWAKLKDSGFANTILAGAKNWMTTLSNSYRKDGS